MTATENKNLRFTVYYRGSPVKITLKPNQRLNHFEGKQTEEGYQCYGTVLEHLGHGVRRQITSWGRDCDGRWSSRDDEYCAAENLYAEENYYGDKIPRWEGLGSTNYDQYAEAAGY
jgi:hypothetical protein